MRDDQHDDQRVTWSVATASDIDAFYGERPCQTMKAIVIRRGCHPVGIIGMVLDKHVMRAFSEYVPEFEPHLRSMAVLRAIKAAQQMFSATTWPVIAMRGSDCEILKRVGFELVEGDVYRWRGA